MAFLFVAITAARAAEEDDVKVSANAFIDAMMDTKNVAQTFERFAGPRMRQTQTKDTLAEYVGLYALQFGGKLKDKQFIGAQHLTQWPGTNEKGNFYFLRYRTRYPTADVFTDLWMERADDGWRVISFQFIPAPAGG